MQNSTKLYSILCFILVVCASYVVSQPSFPQPGTPPNIGGFPQGPGGPAVGGFPQAPSPGGFPQGPGAGIASGVGGANSFNAYNSLGSNLGGLGGFGGNPGLGGFGTANARVGGFGAGTPGLGGFGAGTPNLGGFGAGTPGLGGFGAGTPNLGGFGAGTPNLGGFGTNTPNLGGFGTTTPGFGNVGFGQPAVQSAAPFRAANTPTHAPVGTFQANQPTHVASNPLTSLFGGGQNIGAGMSVDQMRTLDNALFGNGANIFQTEQPSATFSYPLNQRAQQAYQTATDASNTYTTQQFGPMGPTANPMGPTANPMGPGASPFGPGAVTPGLGGFGNSAASSLLNSALLNGAGGGMNPYGYGQQQQQQQQLQTNPAYSSLTSGFNDLLTGVGAGLTNAGRDIASGYAPPSLNPNPSTGYAQNAAGAATTPVSPGNPVPTAASSSSYTSSYTSSVADAPARTTSPPNYGTSAQHTLTATYPGVGLVDLGVPIIGQQSTETGSPTRFRASSSATPPLQSAERVSIMQAKRQEVN